MCAPAATYNGLENRKWAVTGTGGTGALNNYVGATHHISKLMHASVAMCPQWWQALYELVRIPYTTTPVIADAKV